MNTKRTKGWKAYIILYSHLIKLHPTMKDNIDQIFQRRIHKYYKFFQIDQMVISENIHQYENKLQFGIYFDNIFKISDGQFIYLEDIFGSLGGIYSVLTTIIFGATTLIIYKDWEKSIVKQIMGPE